MLTLSRTLLYRTPPTQWLLVQTPPSIPTLAIAYLAAPLRGTKLLVDWHNYGWSVLATSRGGSSASNHPFVRASRRYESLMARIAPDASLAVTEAMAKQLRAPPYNAKTAVLTLHDRPAALFKPIGSAVERRRTLERIEQTSTLAGPICDGSTRLLVSSTSWTPDEDFGLLLDAVVRYTSVSPDPTPLLLVITGKGPQKAEYEARIAALRAEGKLPGIRIVTAWLTLEDYAALLAVADLGLCLHRSTSGVDLPMKVVDMFGAGLPVAAYAGYESFGELVREGENGFAFETADDLAELLARLFGGAGGSKRGLSAAAELENARKGALKEGSRRWDDEWDEVVAPLLGFSRKEGPNRTD